MPVATPYIARMPSIKIINGTASETELVCHARTVRLTPEDSEVDVDTFCNPDGIAPGTTKWTAEFDALQSFSNSTTAPGLWDTLRPLAKTEQVFRIVPDGTAAISVTNPRATFTAWVPSIPFVDNDRGQSAVMTITLNVVGEPEFATTTS